MKKLVAMALCICMTALCVSAFAASDEVAFAPMDEQVTMTVGRQSMNSLELPDGDDMEHNKYLDYIQEKTGVKIEYEWLVDSSTYNQKVNLAVASGDIPDVMIVTSKAQLQQLVENDLVADLSGLAETYLSDYVMDIYNSYGDKAWESATFDGKVMALPNLEAGYSFSYLWVRKDWIDAVGAEVPTTLDEVVALAKLFMEKDPGNNGEGNTIGIAVNTKVAGVYNNLGNIDPIFATFGSVPRQWLRGEDGTISYGSVAPETKEALAYLAGLYADGVIDKEFAVRTSDDFNALLLSGKCGIFFGPWWMPDWPLNSSKANNPDSDWIPVLAPLSADGNLYAYKQDISTTWLVVNKNYEHPEAVYKVMNWFYYGMRGFDPAVSEFYPDSSVTWDIWPLPILLNYDDECVTNSKAISAALETRDTSGLSAENLSFYNQCLLWLDDGDTTGWQTYTGRVIAPAVAGSENVKFFDNVYPAQTDTMDMKWAQLEKIEDEAILKIIMGEMSVDAFDTFVSNWYAQGGQEITDEVNAQFAGK